MLKLATSSAIFLTLNVAFIAEAANCPLVDVQGTYLVQLITENSPEGCPVKGGGYVNIGADGLMVQSDAFNYHGGWPGKFGGRIEPGAEPMQWTGTSSHEYYAIEYQGSWKQGQLSGKFIAKGAKGTHKGLECLGKVVGFKAKK
ncbi:hypothetical protein NIES2100_44940 [Calothrix sp. NIES-2100]|uniref:hypothetical protein n=1 Tax=Calothrix sp. NIES-2100 TaxID=1954172 RepID=UPI000B61201D|nr:hypothetical protein NIES2100_44940 [Calothrix sp. NIES-2100]